MCVSFKNVLKSSRPVTFASRRRAFSLHSEDKFPLQTFLSHRSPWGCACLLPSETTPYDQQKSAVKERAHYRERGATLRARERERERERSRVVRERKIKKTYWKSILEDKSCAVTERNFVERRRTLCCSSFPETFEDFRKERTEEGFLILLLLRVVSSAC